MLHVLETVYSLMRKKNVIRYVYVATKHRCVISLIRELDQKKTDIEH